MEKNFLLLLTLFVLLFIGCSDDKKYDTDICDLRLAFYTLRVVDSDDVFITLDSYKVFYNDKDITKYETYAWDSNKEDELDYVILTSASDLKKEFLNKRVPLTIKGYIDDKEVFETTWEFSANECGVFPITNPDGKTIVLETK